MAVKNEIMFDFGFSMPRVLVAGNTAVIDNVEKIVMVSTTSVTVDCGTGFTSVSGSDFIIKEIADGRMLIEGEIRSVEFYKTLSSDKG